MPTPSRALAVVLALVVLGAAVMTGLPALAAEPSFLPLPGSAIGVLVPDAARVLDREGRSGPPDAVLFSRDGASYHYMLLPAAPGEAGEPATVEVGEDWRPRTYDNVVLARRPLIEARGLPRGYALVEVEVNGGQGSPPTDRFVATRIRRLDGTREMPLVLAKAVEAAIEQCRRGFASGEADARLEQARKSELAGAADLAREQRLIPYVTWLSASQRVQVVCTAEAELRERRRGIGTVPDRPYQPQGVEYGRVVGVRRIAQYTILPSGQVSGGPSGPLEPYAYELPPPGGASHTR